MEEIRRWFPLAFIWTVLEPSTGNLSTGKHLVEFTRQPTTNGAAVPFPKVPINVGSIPEELKELNQWVGWRFEHRTNSPKPTKVPYDPSTGSRASTTGLSTWVTFEKALSYFSSGHCDGIGFVFTPDDPYVGVDLDGCWDSLTGTMESWAADIVKRLDSYTEISPSGKGIHILVKGKLPPGRRRKDGIEMYDLARYFTMTGRTFGRLGVNIAYRTEELEQLHGELFSKEPTQQPMRSTVNLGDDQLIERAKSAANGLAFSRLWDGDWTKYTSQSEADLALCGMLAFWTGNDPLQVDRLFRASGLVRDKWDERRGELTYGQITVTKSLSGSTVANRDSDLQPNPESSQTHRQNRFQAATEAEALLSQGWKVARGGGVLYVYDDLRGVYRPGEDELQRFIAKPYLGDRWSPYRADSIIKYLRVTAPLLWERPPLDRLNVRNGILDLDTLELHPHSPEFLSPVQLGAEWNPLATCPEIDRFLAQVLPPDIVKLGPEIVGYLALPDTSFQKAFLLVGSGANGKTTFFNIVTTLLGAENLSNVTLHDLGASRFASAGLYGKLANICADIPSSRLENVAMFKSIVGGDTVTAERKHEPPFSFQPFARLAFSANEVPGSPDTSYAYLRRWIIVPFPNQFSGDEIDKHLLQKLTTTEELSGLLRQAVDAYRNLQIRGEFTSGSSTDKAAKEFLESIDPIAVFISEMTFEGKDTRVGKTALYNDYKGWCTDNGRQPVSAQKFNQRLKGHLSGVVEKIINGNKFWSGIGSLYFGDSSE